MDYQTFLRDMQQAIHLANSGHLKESVDAFYKLILSDISDIDKAALSANMAMIYDKMGNTDEALAWFDKGIANEQAYCRYEVSEKKAQYLSQIGRHSEAAAIYEELVGHPFVSEAQKERMRAMIKTLLSKTLGGWK